MYSTHNVHEIRILLTDKLLDADKALQAATDDLNWLQSHFKVDWSYAPLYPMRQEILKDIKKLWAMSDEDVKARYQEHVPVRVMD